MPARPICCPRKARSRCPSKISAPVRSPRLTHRRAYWVPRAAVFAGALLLTGAFAYELYAVLSFVRMTPIQLVFLVLSTHRFRLDRARLAVRCDGLPAAVRR